MAKEVAEESSMVAGAWWQRRVAGWQVLRRDTQVARSQGYTLYGMGMIACADKKGNMKSVGNAYEERRDTTIHSMQSKVEREKLKSILAKFEEM